MSDLDRSLDTGPKTGEWMTIARWGFIGALCYSYSLASLFAPTEGGAGISPIVIPSVLFLIAAACYGFWQATPNERVSIGLAALIVVVLNVVVVLTMRSIDLPKFLLFGGAWVIFGVLTAFTFCARRIVDHLGFALVLISLIAVVALVLNRSEFDAGRLTYGDSNPIWMARILGLGSIGTFFIAITRQKLFYVMVAIGLLLVGGVALTGSRGPLLSVAIAVALGSLLFRFDRKLAIVLGSLVPLAVVALLLEQYGFLSELRALSVGDAADVSYNLRLILFDHTIDLIKNNASGIGIGYFQFYGFAYPHNIFLEFFVEWGWFYGIFFIVAVILAGIGLLINRGDMRILILLFVYEVANASVSGDITSPRLLYGLMFFGVATLLVKVITFIAANGRHRVEPMARPRPNRSA